MEHRATKIQLHTTTTQLQTKCAGRNDLGSHETALLKTSWLVSGSFWLSQRQTGGHRRGLERRRSCKWRCATGPRPGNTARENAAAEAAEEV